MGSCWIMVFNVIIFTRHTAKYKTDWKSQKRLSQPNTLGLPMWSLGQWKLRLSYSKRGR